MSNMINVKVTSLDAKSLLTNPNIVVLDTKDKLILNNISIKISVELIDTIKEYVADGVTILGITNE